MSGFDANRMLADVLWNVAADVLRASAPLGADVVFQLAGQRLKLAGFVLLGENNAEQSASASDTGPSEF